MGLYGCSSQPSSTYSSTPQLTPGSFPLKPEVQQASDLFSNQKVFDPWNLSSTDPQRVIDVYLPANGIGNVYGNDGKLKSQFTSGQYVGGLIANKDFPVGPAPQNLGPNSFGQSLNLYYGAFSSHSNVGTSSWTTTIGAKTWPQFWQKSDIGIVGDPEAQQVTHANMFYLAGSASKNGSIPPMGLSSIQYAGHIFWDAEIWMFPALIAQHPDLARGFIDYRFNRLKAAEALARKHGFKGAEYPWESAATGDEVAPEEFSHERHITADVAYAAWQYYLWTGDKAYLESEAWPIIKDSADYWVSRATKTADGKYHIDNVIGPDETSGTISDDAYTNAIVAQTLRDAALAAKAVGQSPDPDWKQVADGLVLPKSADGSHYIEYPTATDSLKAKQADTQMLIYPLNVAMSADCAGKTLDYALSHTETHGPAMTDSVNAIVAAKLGRAQQSLDLFHNSYRPFMRGPWDAFSEKRSTNGVYFCTGMGGCLQAVLYGFGGLHVVESGQTGQGQLVARGTNASLWIQPHLPTGWSELTIKGVEFQGHTYDVDIKSPGSGMVTKRS